MIICKSCGKELIDHKSVVSVCRDLETALSALRVISTWASFQGGSELAPEHVEALIKRTLEKIGK